VVAESKNKLAESGAILDYLVETYGEGKFAPERGTPSYLRYRYWMHYAEGSLATPLLLQLVFDQIERKSPFIVRPVAKAISSQVKGLLVTPNLKRHFDYLEGELTEHGPWFAGRSFSAADVQMSFGIEAAAARGLLKNRPKLADWLRRIHERPAYQRALEQGGPFDLSSF